MSRDKAALVTEREVPFVENTVIYHFVFSLQVHPLGSSGQPVGDKLYVRTGLLGFLGPVSLLNS